MTDVIRIMIEPKTYGFGVHAQREDASLISYGFSNLDDLLEGLGELLDPHVKIGNVSVKQSDLDAVEKKVKRMFPWMLEPEKPAGQQIGDAGSFADAFRQVQRDVAAFRERHKSVLAPDDPHRAEPDDGWRVWEGGASYSAMPAGVSAQDLVAFQLRGDADRDEHSPAMANRLDWRHEGLSYDIIAYRVVLKAPPKPADEWIPWDGKGEPKLSDYERIMVRFQNGDEEGPAMVRGYMWDHSRDNGRDIIAYKILGADL